MLNLVNWILHLRHTRWLQLSLNWKSVDSVNVTSMQTGHSVVGELSIKSWIVSQFLILSLASIKKFSLEETTKLPDVWAFILTSTILMFIFWKCNRPLKKNLKTFWVTDRPTFINFLQELSSLIIANTIFSYNKRSHHCLKIGNVMLSQEISFKLIIILSNK